MTVDPRARSATIAVDGRLVKWARESAGLSDAALVKKLGIKDRAKLTAWEAPGARANLTPRQLERLSDATKRPLAAFFLPEPPAEPILPDFRRPPGEEPPPLSGAAEQGARLFSVSRHVILRRVLSAQAIRRETYRRTVGAWQAGRRPPRRKAKGGAPPYLMTVSELGARFVSRVLAAHERGLIGDSDVSDYLTLRLKHLDRVQELVAVA